jgi:hypothetical protein
VTNHKITHASFLDEMKKRSMNGIVVDVGGGKDCFVNATHVLDINKNYKGSTPEFINHNICVGKFPFEDKSVDFVHCTHVLEDIECPENALIEMRRIAKSGYFECPSVIFESSRIDSSLDIRMRGAAHHRWFVYFDKKAKTVHLLPKYPIVEYLSFHNEQQILMEFSAREESWSRGFIWDDTFDIKVYRYDQDYLVPDYRYKRLIMQLVQREMEDIRNDS